MARTLECSASGVYDAPDQQVYVPSTISCRAPPCSRVSLIVALSSLLLSQQGGYPTGLTIYSIYLVACYCYCCPPTAAGLGAQGQFRCCPPSRVVCAAYSHLRRDWSLSASFTLLTTLFHELVMQPFHFITAARPQQ